MGKKWRMAEIVSTDDKIRDNEYHTYHIIDTLTLTHALNKSISNNYQIRRCDIVIFSCSHFFTSDSFWIVLLDFYNFCNIHIILCRYERRRNNQKLRDVNKTKKNGLK